MGITTGVLACSADPSLFSWTTYTVICLGGVAGPVGECPLSSSASPVFRFWAITGTHSFPSSSFGSMSSASQSQAIVLACASNSHMLAYIQFSRGKHSQFIGTHMRYHQSHPHCIGWVCSHQALHQLLNGAVYLLLEDTCLGMHHLARFKFGSDCVYWVSVG